MKILKFILILLVTIGIFALWVLPYFIGIKFPGSPWGFLYFPVFVLSFFWGDFIVTYVNKNDL